MPAERVRRGLGKDWGPGPLGDLIHSFSHLTRVHYKVPGGVLLGIQQGTFWCREADRKQDA